MGRYIVSRLIQTILVLAGLITVVFFLIRLAGDPVALILGGSGSQEAIDRLRHALGFDRPLHVQFLVFVRGVAHGDLGNSIAYGDSCMSLVLERLPATIELTAAAILIVIAIAVPMGLVAAIREGSAVDLVVRVFAVLGQATPTYWLGLMLIIVVAVHLRLVPTGGRAGLRSLILPSITLSLWSVGRVSRVTRSSVLEILREDYVRTARSKGLTERSINVRHVLKNASIVIVTLVGLESSAMFGGAIITEAVFAWPGLGRLITTSIYQRDFPVVQAAVLVIGVVICLLNLATDVLYSWLDPRIRYE